MRFLRVELWGYVIKLGIIASGSPSEVVFSPSAKCRWSAGFQIRDIIIGCTRRAIVKNKLNYSYPEFLIFANLSVFGKLNICFAVDVFKGDLLIWSPLATIMDI